MKPFPGASGEQYRENILHKQGFTGLVSLAGWAFYGVQKSLWA
jgi:hypothetical protein